MKIVLIGVFGLLGIYSRYFIDTIITFKNNSFPISTLIVNLLGCVLAGILFAFIQNKTENIFVTPLLIGYCGGLTTFSSYCLQGFQLMSQGETSKAFLYIVISPFIGLLLVFTSYYFMNQYSN
jgi:CrcB protein